MSATNRGAKRQTADFYPTPAWCTHRLLEAAELPDGDWLEPCAGEGAIIRAAREVRPKAAWTAVELRAECAPLLTRILPPFSDIRAGVDFLKADWRHFDVVLTNPPYFLAREFVDKCVSVADHVVMLLRINFLGSEDRQSWWRSRKMPDVWVLPNRPSFAVMVTCKENPEHKRFVSVAEAEGLKACPECNAKVKKTSSDSTEYAWFHWYEGSLGRVRVLDVTPEEER